MAPFQVNIEEICASGESKINGKMLIVSDSYMKGTLTTFINLVDLKPSMNQFLSDFLCSYRIFIKSSK